MIYNFFYIFFEKYYFKVCNYQINAYLCNWRRETLCYGRRLPPFGVCLNGERNEKHHKPKRAFCTRLALWTIEPLDRPLYVGRKISPRTADGLSNTPRKGVQSINRTEDGKSPPKGGVIQSGRNLCGRLINGLNSFCYIFVARINGYNSPIGDIMRLFESSPRS